MIPKGEVIGETGAVEADMNELIRNSERLPEALDSGAQKVVDNSISIARAKGLVDTGKGVSGIDYERENDDRLIGWGPRPNFHLYFHETGTYKDYPRPHVRPAADQTENEIVEDIRRTVVGD